MGGGGRADKKIGRCDSFGPPKSVILSCMVKVPKTQVPIDGAIIYPEK